MPRQVRNAKLDTRSARAKLPVRKAPYWTGITRGCALGYRKGRKGGMWLAKYVQGKAKARQEEKIGPADDVMDADGATALSFAQAQEQAREFFSRAGKEAAGEPTADGPYTVSDAAKDYLEWFRAHRKSIRETEYAINGHVLPALGALEVGKLTTGRLRAWQNQMVASPARLRTRRGKAQQYRDATDDPDSIRRRRASANRVLTVLKAILNHAWHEGKIASDEAWRRVKPFGSADAPKVRYLTEAEITRLVNACESDFRQLVRAALLTGCRYGELAAMRCADFTPDTGMVYVRPGKGGKGRHVTLSEEGQAFYTEATAGRPGDALVFLRTDGEPWGKSHQARPIAEACERASISPPASFHVLRHTHASHLAMRGVPLMVIAHQLGHSDTRMAERHYTHLAPSYIADAIRAGLPTFGIVKPSSVQIFRHAGDTA